ncbi:hypothetical protein [Leptospira sp. 'Mane']|uniref:hypothetical protein n=1 Tax=Leptospira sp. 'Mane' TaxID=3387407 RepID=UPI00398AB205
MSLSAHLKNENIKKLFSNFVTIPKIKSDMPIKAEPLTKRYGIVGTAFDYLLRFVIERTNLNSISQTWTAQVCANSFFERNEKAKKIAISIIENALNSKTQFIKSGKITNDLIVASINLAYIDTIFRSRKIELVDSFINDVSNPDEKDIQDIKNLYSLIEIKMFKSKSICVLNPTFGKASELVQGADADLFIDNTLIDIKTVKNMALTSEYIYQLVGYFLLSKIDKIDGISDKYSIKNLGLYFSRFAELITLPIDQLIEINKLPEFQKLFIKEIKSKIDKS